MERSPVRYVSVGDSEIAYQVVGAGPRDIVWMYALGSQIDLVWQMPSFATSIERLARFGRVLIFDRRGTGASGLPAASSTPSWEACAEDVEVVMDAAGFDRATLIGFRETGQIGMLFAAMHPERVESLVVLNSTARFSKAPDYLLGESEENVEIFIATVASLWGTEELALASGPRLARDPASIRASAILMRASATPAEATRQYRHFLLHVDVRAALPSVRVPTLVLHVEDSPMLPVAHGRYLAENLPDATFVVLPGGDLGGGLVPEATDAISEFLTGSKPVEPSERILTTILFTDIVSSTERVAAMGDRAWHELLNNHDRIMREQIERFRGREVNTTGDGFVTCFDGPGRAIGCAQAMRDACRDMGIELHLGLHTGECEVRGDDLAGMTVHIAARVCADAPGGVIVVSRTVADLMAGSSLSFRELGERQFKGVPGSWNILALNEEQA